MKKSDFYYLKFFAPILLSLMAVSCQKKADFPITPLQTNYIVGTWNDAKSNQEFSLVTDIGHDAKIGNWNRIDTHVTCVGGIVIEDEGSFNCKDTDLQAVEMDKDIEMIRVSDYDTAEAATVESLIDETKKDLATAKTRKDVYEIMENFNDEVAKVKTKTQKELEEAKKEAEEARNSNNNNNNNNSNNNNG